MDYGSSASAYRVVELKSLNVANDRVADGAHLTDRVRVLSDALTAQFQALCHVALPHSLRTSDTIVL